MVLGGSGELLVLNLGEGARPGRGWVSAGRGGVVVMWVSCFEAGFWRVWWWARGGTRSLELGGAEAER